MQYYCNITNAHANNFIGKYHYYNQGLKCFRDLAGCKGENTSRIKLNKLTHTLRTRPVRVPYNTIPLLTILFECIFSNSNLKEVFLNIVLRNCIYYSEELANYPSDCLIGIFGHIYVFIKNIATLQIYPDKYISFSEKFENCMRQMIQRYDFAKNCVQRKTN